MPDPIEIATTVALSERVSDIIKWGSGVAVLIIGWAWKASKEHSRIQNIEQRADRMEATLKVLEKTIEEDLITHPEHEMMQAQCQEHIARTQAEKLHRAVLDMKEDYNYLREEMSIMNANICKLLGKFNVEPVQPNGKARRKSDFNPPSTL